MLLYKPQVQLFHTLVFDGPNEYILHAVTFCDQTNLREGGFHIHALNTEKENLLQIDLVIQEDNEKPMVHSLNPIVHTIKVGPVAFKGEGFFETRIVMQKAVKTRGDDDDSGSTSGTTTSSTTSSKKVDRPIDESLIAPKLF